MRRTYHPKMMRRLSLLLCLALTTGTALAQSQTDWNAPFPPHRVMDNLYFVGTAQLEVLYDYQSVNGQPVALTEQRPATPARIAAR